MIWLDYLQINAERKEDAVESERIRKWFSNLQQIFRDIYDCQELVLNYKRNNAYKYSISGESMRKTLAEKDLVTD
jgi:hypothetical protein